MAQPNIPAPVPIKLPLTQLTRLTTTPAPHNSNLSASSGLTDSELLLHFMPWGAHFDRALTPALYALGIAGNALAYRAWHSIHRSRTGLAAGLGLEPGTGWPPSCAPGMVQGPGFGFEGREGAGNEVGMACGPMSGPPLGAAACRQKRSRVPFPNSTRLYLSALALVDGLFLITHVLHELQFSWSVRVLNFPIICDVYFAVLAAFANLNPLLVLLVTIDLQLAIRNRLRVRAFCSRRTAQIWLAISAFVALGLAAPQLFLWTFDYRLDQRRCRQRPALENNTAWRGYLTASEGALDGVVALLTYLLSVASVINFSKMLKRYSRRQWLMNVCTSFPPYAMPFQANAAYGHLTQSDNESSASNEQHNQQSFGYQWPQVRSPSRLALYNRSNNHINNIGAASVAARVSEHQQLLRAYRPFVYTLLSLGFMEATCLTCDALAFVVRSTVERGDETLPDLAAHQDQIWQRYFTYASVRKLLEELSLARHALPALLYIMGIPAFRQYLCSVVTCGCYDYDDGDEAVWPFPLPYPMQMAAVGERTPSKLALGPVGAPGFEPQTRAFTPTTNPTLNDLRAGAVACHAQGHVVPSAAAVSLPLPSAGAVSLPPPIPPPPSATDESDSESTLETSPGASPMAYPAMAHQQNLRNHLRAQYIAQPPTLV